MPEQLGVMLHVTFKVAIDGGIQPGVKSAIPEERLIPGGASSQPKGRPLKNKMRCSCKPLSRLPERITTNKICSNGLLNQNNIRLPAQEIFYGNLCQTVAIGYLRDVVQT